MKNPDDKKLKSVLSDVLEAAEEAGMPTEVYEDEEAGVSVATVDVSKLQDIPGPLQRIMKDQAVSGALAAAIGVHTKSDYSHTVTVVYQILHILSINLEEFNIPRVIHALAALHEASQKSMAMFESANEDKH